MRTSPYSSSSISITYRCIHQLNIDEPLRCARRTFTPIVTIEIHAPHRRPHGAYWGPTGMMGMMGISPDLVYTYTIYVRIYIRYTVYLSVLYIHTLYHFYVIGRDRESLPSLLASKFRVHRVNRAVMEA